MASKAFPRPWQISGSTNMRKHTVFLRGQFHEYANLPNCSYF